MRWVPHEVKVEVDGGVFLIKFEYYFKQRCRWNNIKVDDADDQAEEEVGIGRERDGEHRDVNY